jgi:hypothetical protein
MTTDNSTRAQHKTDECRLLTCLKANIELSYNRTTYSILSKFHYLLIEQHIFNRKTISHNISFDLITEQRIFYLANI